MTSPVKLVGKIRLGRLANNGKSKMAAPSHGFSQILEEMQKATETGWDSLVNVCYEIRKVVGEFSFKESMVDEINVDFYAQQIVPSQELEEYVPLNSTGDRSCLYRSVKTVHRCSEEMD